MLLLMLISGLRLAWARLEHRKLIVRVLGALFLAPFVHFASLVDNISIIIKVTGIKKNRRQEREEK